MDEQKTNIERDIAVNQAILDTITQSLNKIESNISEFVPYYHKIIASLREQKKQQEQLIGTLNDCLARVNVEIQKATELEDFKVLNKEDYDELESVLGLDVEHRSAKELRNIRLVIKSELGNVLDKKELKMILTRLDFKD